MRTTERRMDVQVNEKEISFESKLICLQDNMMNFAMTLTANRDQAKDLTQESILKVLDNKDKYYDNVNFKGWVFTIMHNIFVNNYRKMVRSQTVVDSTENLYHLNLPQNSGFESPEGSYTLSEIQKVMDSFTNDYKVPFTMHVDGFKYEEIAQKLGLPVGTIKSRIFFARKRMQEMLKDYKYADRD